MTVSEAGSGVNNKEKKITALKNLYNSQNSLIPKIFKGLKKYSMVILKKLYTI